MTENFPVASILLPRWSRPYVRGFYDFARRADDIADDARTPAHVRRACLAALDGVLENKGDIAGVDNAPQGFASALASARVLRDSFDRASLDVTPARELLKAFRLDTEKDKWDDWDDLMGYCQLSAVPVGRFLLNLFGGARDEGASVAALTAALQVLNHLQDVRDDYLDMDRVYLPVDILHAAGATRGDLGRSKATDAVRVALDRTLDHTDHLLDRAVGVARDLHSPRLALEAAVIFEIARSLSRKLRRRDPLAERVRLGGAEYAGAVFCGLVRGVSMRWLGAGSAADGGDVAARAVRGAKSSFFWGMRLLPRERRGALYAIYAFCRAVDDVVDDAVREVDEKTADLDLWQENIAALYRGDEGAISLPLVRALMVPVRQFDLKQEDFLAVITGMRTDVAPRVRFADRAAFDLYCDQVAGAVGRLANPVFGISGEDGNILARELGRAMQITNILRDLGEDAARDRLYLPLDLLAHYNVCAGSDLSAVSLDRILSDPALGAALDSLAQAAEDGFLAADVILRRADARAAAPVRVMMKTYHRLLARLRGEGLTASVHRPRISIGMMERIWIALRYGVLHGR